MMNEEKGEKEEEEEKEDEHNFHQFTAVFYENSLI